MSRVAFLGLGTMGRGMVANLKRAGHDLIVWNRSGVDDATRELGVEITDSVAGAVAGADFVMYCLAEDEAVRAVALGPGGVVETADPSSIIIDLSTIDPQTSDAEAAAYRARGIRFLDAPVFGSKNEAAQGGLWIVVGGERADYEASLPVLEPISETTHYMGEQGSGARMKLVGNLTVAAQLHALGESLTLARKAGLQLRDVLDVFAVTDFKSPIFDGVGAAVIAGDYSPSFALDLMHKDARLVTAYADRLGVSVPGTRATLGTIEKAVNAGWGAENASALIKAIAGEADVDLREP